jgi:hypothetical protein
MSIPTPFLPSPKKITPGIWFQIYRGAVQGRSAAQRRSTLRTYMHDISTMGLPGVVLHGFPRELLSVYKELLDIGKELGLPVAFSWGLDGSRDNDGSRLTAEEKGSCMGEVLTHPETAFGLIDAETAWDRDTGTDDDADEAGALAMGKELRKLAPDAVLGDQPWFAIQSHGDERKEALDIGSGGTFRGFPSDEFASFVDFRAAQVYWNDARGKDRAQRIQNWHEKDWREHDTSLARKGLVRPRTYTLQGYGHDDIPYELAASIQKLLDDDKPVILWGEPYPTYVTIRIVRAVMKLRGMGYVGTGAVKRFQNDANQHGAGLSADDRLGLKTADALLGVDR